MNELKNISDKTSLADKSILIAGLFFISTGIAFYYLNPSSLFILRNLKPIASVSHLEFESMRKIPGTISWLDTDLKDVLYNGDQILTDETSSLTVKFDEGSKLLIGPQSLIKIEMQNKKFQINVIKGQLNFQGKTGSASFIDNESGQVINATNGMTISSSRYGLLSKNTDNSTVNGKINYLKSPRQGEVIDPEINDSINLDLKEKKNGTISIYDGNGKKISEQKLQFADSTSVKAPPPGRYNVILKDEDGNLIGMTQFKVLPYKNPTFKPLSDSRVFYRGESLPIEWSGPNHGAYQLIITTPDGTSKVAPTQNRFSLRLLSEGKHTLKVIRHSESTDYTSEAMVLNIRLQDNLNFPPEQLNQTVKSGENIVLDVQSTLQSKKFISELSTDKDFSNIIKVVKSQSSNIKITTDQPGIYYLRTQTDGANSEISPTVKVVVSAPVATISKNFKNKIVSHTDQTDVVLTWKLLDGIEQVRLQVSEDPGFNNIILDKETNATSETISMPKLKKYYWRILPLTGTPEYITNSEASSVEMTLPAPLKTPEIIAKQIIDYIDIDGVATYQIELKSHKFAKEYLLEIYSDEALKTPLFKKAVAAPLVNWASNRTGKYYYRYKIIDIWGRTSNYSNVGILVFPISPMVEIDE